MRRAIGRSVGSVVVGIVLAALAGCRGSYKEYRDLPVQALTFEQVWNACLDSARTEFRLDRTATDSGERVFTTHWRNELVAFGKGRRRRAEFRVEEAPAGGWRVRYYVERQRNTEMARPFTPQEDDWTADGQDTALEERLAQHLRLRFEHARLFEGSGR